MSMTASKVSPQTRYRLWIIWNGLQPDLLRMVRVVRDVFR